jgi:3-oxoacyl-[acyl-carrier protein] reductase
MFNDLKNKNILVTGSTRGIGRGIAETLLAAGATVGIHGRDPQQVDQICQEIDPNRRQTIPLSADLGQDKAPNDLVASFVAKIERLDGVVNNAGGGKAIAFRGVTNEKWRNTFKINLDAAMQICQSAFNIMRKQKSGCIVNITSMAAHGPGKWMGADYAASKAALVSLTKSLAFEAARLGIRVNAVSPGMVETDMTEFLPEKMRNGLNIPMQRFATPAEIGKPTAFLLSETSNYITGQVLHVDGGLWMGNS